MKIKIDEKGCLWFKVAGKMKRVFCIFSHSTPEEQNFCGDWCVFWKEPLAFENSDNVLVRGIAVCDKYYDFKSNDLVDERRRV